MSVSHDGIDLKNSPLAGARGGLDLCVHCGFCLQACPTYLALEDENDSPRGRIVLMHALLEGDVAVDDDAVHTHISRCLGCRGCETACPSGVPFGHLLEATRATLREHRPTPLIARMLLALFAQPVVLGVAMFFARGMRSLGIARLLGRLPGRIGVASAMLAATSPTRFSRTTRAHAAPPVKARAPHPDTQPVIPADKRHPGESRGGIHVDAQPVIPAKAGIHVSGAEDSHSPRNDNEGSTVALFEGCVMRELYGHVHEATRATLVRNGYTLAGAPGQRCCGALHAHTGDLEKARELARTNIASFEKNPADRIAVNAAGCGAMLKEYAALLEGDADWAPRARAFAARVADITELLEQRGPSPGNPVPITVAYDAPCHLQHAQRITSAPVAVFCSIPGLVLVQAQDSDKCCGAAGIYNLIEPETSSAVLSPKLAELQGTNAEVVCTGNPGCMMQIGAGLLRSGSTMQVAHPVELLDYSYRNE